MGEKGAGNLGMVVWRGEVEWSGDGSGGFLRGDRVDWVGATPERDEPVADQEGSFGAQTETLSRRVTAKGSNHKRRKRTEERSLLKPIKRVRLYENAVEQIQSLILRHRYEPGDRLPPERALAEQLKISRPSLREALRILSVMGLIEIRVGDGIYVKEVSFLPYIESVNLSISSRLQVEKDSFLKLWQARKILEAGMVELAAKQMSEPFLKNLWHCIEEMEKNIENQDVFISAGIRFHRLIAERSQNEILILLWDTLGNLVRRSHDKIYRIARSPKRSLLAHKRIYVALKKGDVQKSVEAMRKHMEEEEEALLAALTRVKP
jgi:GntR family transcriptional repressor for pyruvate dehydrogenase complex